MHHFRVAQAIKQRVHTVGSILVYYGPRPRRFGEVWSWAMDRNRSTLDLRVPWWNYHATRTLRSRLPRSPIVFEYGGGGSTLWLSDLGAEVTTVEHDEHWYNELENACPPSVQIVRSIPSASGSVRSESATGVYFDDYVRTIESVPAETLDLVIIDGRARVDCARIAATKVKPGGLLLLDDSDRSRYRPVFEILRDWLREDYRGVKPGKGGLVQTSIWSRPAHESKLYG